MTEQNDHQLLAEFARRHSEPAFAEIVARYVDLVYSAARRFTGNGHHAEEITQAVFLILARKAGRLSERVVLSGWLYQAARLTAANFVKGEIRRQKREQEAYMQSTMNETDDPVAWEQIAPWLDQAMGQLGETDRNAVVLRYFQNKTAAETAVALQLTEAAAHKRINRALEKLRKIFSQQRGVTLSATLLASAVSAGSVHAAPAGLTATVTAVTAHGVTLSAALTTLVNGTMKTMTWLKLKFSLGVSVTALLAGGVATVAVSQTRSDPLTTPEIFQKARAAYAALDSYRDEGKTVAVLNGTTITHAFTIKLARPDFYRIEWQSVSASAVYTSTTTTQAVWSAGQGDFLQYLGGEPEKCKDKETALSGATGISGGAAATIPGTFFKLNWGNQLGGTITDEKRLADERVGTNDCYVFTKDRTGRTSTIWIGKSDFLIRQTRTVTSAASMKAVMAEAAKRHPDIAASMPKREYSDTVSTETHDNIVVNPKLTPADFAP